MTLTKLFTCCALGAGMNYDEFFQSRNRTEVIEIKAAACYIAFNDERYSVKEIAKFLGLTGGGVSSLKRRELRPDTLPKLRLAIQRSTCNTQKFLRMEYYKLTGNLYDYCIEEYTIWLERLVDSNEIKFF
jgi:hypothetical protein